MNYLNKLNEKTEGSKEIKYFSENITKGTKDCEVKGKKTGFGKGFFVIKPK